MENNNSFIKPIKADLLICTCSSPDHQIIIRIDEDNDVFCTIHLAHLRWHKRIWLAIRYIFGYKCDYGNFQEFILGQEHAEKLQEVVNILKK